MFCLFSLFVCNRVVLFCGLVAERQYNPPSSSSCISGEFLTVSFLPLSVVGVFQIGWWRHRDGFLPNLAVLVRDFELDLAEGSTANDYLEELLAPVESGVDASLVAAECNEWRSGINACFSNRTCLTLPHPMVGSGAVGKASQLGSVHCKPSAEFLEEVAAVVSVRS